MKIINFSLSKISAEKNKTEKGKIEIKSKIDLKDVKEESISISSNKAINLSFSYSVEYTPKFGKIELEGNVIMLAESNETESIMKEWKKKQIPDTMKTPLFNFIMTKCNLKALQLEEELGLPTHIPMPKFSVGKPKEGKNPDYAG